jgi:hypothetical protein
MTYRPEPEMLKGYIGKRIEPDVFCSDTTSDYGDSETTESITTYGMLLEEVTKTHLIGRQTADHNRGSQERRAHLPST